jgi:hypothetical protein
MRWAIIFKAVGGLGILIISFFMSLAILAYFDIPHVTPTCPVGKRIVLDKPYPLFGAHGYKLSMPSLTSIGDTDAEMFRSPVVICEDGRVMGPAHIPYAEVAKSGLGRFSNYRGEIVFSSADNTDPNTNGRQYVVVIPSR